MKLDGFSASNRLFKREDWSKSFLYFVSESTLAEIIAPFSFYLIENLFIFLETLVDIYCSGNDVQEVMFCTMYVDIANLIPQEFYSFGWTEPKFGELSKAIFHFKKAKLQIPAKC